MHRPRLARMMVAAATVLGLMTLTSCRDAQKTGHSPISTPVTLTDVCDHSLRAETTSAQQLMGTTQLVLGPPNYQASLVQMIRWLRADTPLHAATAKSRPLCTVGPKGSTAWLTITFEWQPFDGILPKIGSTAYSTEYQGIGYAASSRDDNALIDFSCRVPQVGNGDGRGLYLSALAETEGLDALPRGEKREAQLRVLHAAAVKVAAAMKCVTNLPTTLRTLTPLPPAR